MTSGQKGESRPSSEDGDSDEVRHVSSTVSDTGPPSTIHCPEGARRAASLRAEINQLEELLEARTQAWRSALRQLSEVQGSLAAAATRPEPTHELEAMSSEDWERLDRS